MHFLLSLQFQNLLNKFHVMYVHLKQNPLPYDEVPVNLLHNALDKQLPHLPVCLSHMPQPFFLPDKDLPKNIPITVERVNSDFEVGYRVEKTMKTGNTIHHISDFTTLFTVRRDAETDLWFETGSWKEIDKKTPAVTIYKELWKNSVCTEIKNSKRIYKEFRLKDRFRKIKLGRIVPEQVIQSQAL